MIHYKRTRWYGLSYLVRMHGSLMPRALPAMLLSGSIAFTLSSGLLTPLVGWDLKTFFDDPFGMQMFGVVFGYLMISRLASCYDRYWSGVSNTVAMYDKWLQAISHAIAFESATQKDDAGEVAQRAAYIKHLMKLFTQLSVVAVLKLHSGQPSTGEWLALGSAECQHGITRYSGARRPDEQSASVRRGGAERDSETSKLASFSHAHHDHHGDEAAHARRGMSRRMATRRERRESRSHSIVDGALEGSSLFTLKELGALMQSGDPVNLMANRIHRTRAMGLEPSIYLEPPPEAHSICFPLAARF